MICIWDGKLVVWGGGGGGVGDYFAPQTTMCIGWIENNFGNSTVQFWANIDNQLLKVVYVALSGRNSAKDCDITKEELSIFCT